MFNKKLFVISDNCVHILWARSLLPLRICTFLQCTIYRVQTLQWSMLIPFNLRCWWRCKEFAIGFLCLGIPWLLAFINEINEKYPLPEGKHVLLKSQDTIACCRYKPLKRFSLITDSLLRIFTGSVSLPFCYLELALSSAVLRKKIDISINNICFSFKEMYDYIAKSWKKKKKEKENRHFKSIWHGSTIKTVIVCCARC